jgi:DNA invertase Pin-like site-specific DNA recombinase
MKVSIYLRKSRSDEEVEKRLGDGETLQKHRNMLLKFAKEQKFTIIKIYEEIASGESLFHRPQMLELLKDVEAKLYDAVLCMDVDRLGRGNMQEQGIILETFKRSHTKIVTPRKTYDLQDDFDEEYTEFEAFMSRKELKIITRRMQRGRLHSVNAGNYIANLPPYGYIKSEGTLIPHPDQAPIVQMIFELYTNQKMATAPIANHLNSLGVKTYTNIEWTNNTVSQILDNMVYCGKIVWKKKESRKPSNKFNPNKRREVRKNPKEDWLIVKGRHEALISEDVFDKAQEIKQSKFTPPVKLSTDLVNPLAGLIRCKICDSKMSRRPYQRQVAHLICPNKCGNKSVRFEFVENRLIENIETILNTKFEFQADQSGQASLPAVQIFEKSLQTALNEKEKLENQKLSLYDLLEQGVYDVNTFLERSKSISDRIGALNSTIVELSSRLQKEHERTNSNDFYEKSLAILQNYKAAESVPEKNYLLKSILDRAVYYKTKDLSGDNFELVVYFKI